RNFQNSRSPASENSIGNQQSAISNCPAAMFISASAAETEAAGARLAGTIQPGDVLALVGDLGAGKTQFVKGLAKGLGSTEVRTSRTVTLGHGYQGSRRPVDDLVYYRFARLAAS